MVLVSISDMRSPDFICCSVEFKAPHVQYIDHPALRKWPPALRLFKKGPWHSLLQHAANNGFYQLERSVLEDIASLKGLEVRAGICKTELLFELVSDVTGKSAEDVFDFMYEKLTELEAEAKP